MIHDRKQFIPKAHSGLVYLFHLCIFLNVNFLPAILFKLYSLDSIQSNVASQRGPPTDYFGSNGTIDDVQHHITVIGVNRGTEEKKTR